VAAAFVKPGAMIAQVVRVARSQHLFLAWLFIVNSLPRPN
jgi:hypothetical protein